MLSKELKAKCSTSSWN